MNIFLIIILIIIFLANIFLEITINERKLIFKIFKIPIFFLSSKSYYSLIKKYINKVLKESPQKRQYDLNLIKLLKFNLVSIVLSSKTDDYLEHSIIANTFYYVMPHVFELFKNDCKHFYFKYEENNQNKYNIKINIKVNIILLFIESLKGRIYGRT